MFLKRHLFNDAEVKPFDASNQLASECFGGETTSKTYDSSADKFMDLSFEKTNSAYMLFYEKQKPIPKSAIDVNIKTNGNETNISGGGDELIKSIWTDNIKFMNDKQILEHAYFNFVWQMCDHVPRTILMSEQTVKEEEVTATSLFHATKLGVSFVLDVYVHARDKANMLQWIDLLVKHLNESREACSWLLDYMCAAGSSSCAKIFFKCPNSPVRHMIQRLVLVALTRVLNEDRLCVTKFMHFYLELISVKKNRAIKKCDTQNPAAKFNIRFMCEYFALLFEFARIGLDECLILIRAGAIEKCSEFYLTHRRPHNFRQLTAKPRLKSEEKSRSDSTGIEIIVEKKPQKTKSSRFKRSKVLF